MNKLNATNLYVFDMNLGHDNNNYHNIIQIHIPSRSTETLHHCHANDVSH